MSVIFQLDLDWKTINDLLVTFRIMYFVLHKVSYFTSLSPKAIIKIMLTCK